MILNGYKFHPVYSFVVNVHILIIITGSNIKNVFTNFSLVLVGDIFYLRFLFADAKINRSSLV